jgi:RNA polymerase sigma-70 factor (ECF subfamily)
MCQPKIFRLAYGILHDSAAAEDAVQETFLKGLDRSSTYRGDSAPRAWFASIALNVCRHRLREGKHLESGVTDRKLEGGHRIFRPRTRAAASRAVQHEDHRLLAIAMGYLTESQREVFILHYDQGLSYDEIGEILGLRAGAARALAHRAKANLREKLGSEIWVSKNVDT